MARIEYGGMDKHVSFETLSGKFANPGPEWRGKPFWSWNGRLDRDELIRQVHVLHEMGMGGFFMHSRTGLVTEYLGDEWFDLINACADEAEKLGMEAWLYDEDRWPSGTAGGMVTQDPQYRMHYLLMKSLKPAEYSPNPGLLAAFACRLEGNACYGARRLAAAEPPSFADGPGEPTVLTFEVTEMAPSSFYNGYTYVDTMNPAATQRFLELTHEKYVQRCGDRLGGSIKGIFTDEPHRGALMDPFAGAGMDCRNQVPWTAALPARFLADTGVDLVDHLPEVFLQPEGDPVSQVRWQYVDLLMRMFIDGFLVPINQWCRAHKLELTGHVLHEDSLTAQTVMCGSVARCYEHMGLPGIDLLTENNRAYWVAKQIQSAARQLGQPMVLSELYGCTGWQMPFAGHKAVGDWQALFGVNVRCHHLSWVTMEGEAKRDFPASIFHQSAWWREYSEVEDYFSRLGVALSEGERACDVLVISPVESAWALAHPGWSNFLGALDPAVQALEGQYTRLFHILVGNQIDFDYGDEEMLSRLGSVETTDGGPVLKFGQATYRCVVVGGMLTMRGTTARLLEEFASAGGSVVCAGEAPKYLDAAPVATSPLPSTTVATPFEAAPLASAVVSAVGQAVAVTTPEGGSLPQVFTHLRRTPDGLVVALLNTDRETPIPAARLTLANASALGAQEWHCLTGDRTAASTATEGTSLVVETSLAAGGERLFVLAADLVGTQAPPTACAEVASRPVAGPFRYALHEPNVCVLDMATWRINGGEWQPATEILKIDQKVRTACGLAHRGGEMLQPWFTGLRGYEPLAPVEVRYSFDMATLPETGLELAIERPECFTISVNGTRLERPEVDAWWVDRCFHRIAIPNEALQMGPNTIEIACTYDEGMGLEALYLLGMFCVRLQGITPTLGDLPSSLAATNLCDQGLPYYSGGLTLTMPTGSISQPGNRLWLQVPSWDGACLRVASPGVEPRLVPWHPYEVDITDHAATNGYVNLDIILTRRNTFGPLHQVPLHVSGYGPGNWVTEGAGFVETPNLWPSGLLAPPILQERATGIS